MSLFHPETIDELIENAMTELGHPIIKINITPNQATLAAMKAIDLYVKYHYDATETVYIAQELTPQDISNNFVTTPKNVVSVIRVLGINKIPPTNSYGVGCYSKTGGLYGSVQNIGNNSIGGDLVSVYLRDAHRSFFNSIMFPNIPIEWNEGSCRIRFLGDIRQAANGCGKSVVYEARIVNESLCFDCENPEGNGSKFYDNAWLKSMTVAQIKSSWGSTLKKFTNVSLPGGFEFNGQQLYDEAQQEIERLTTELFARYTTPAMMIVG